MEGLFFIVKGQLDPKKGLKSFDPQDDTTPEWYMCRDNITFNCIACGSDLTTVAKSIRTTMTKYKTRRNYFKHLEEYTTEDYYSVHYLGKRPLSDERKKKEHGKSCGPTRQAKDLYNQVLNTYGDHFDYIVKDMEKQALNSIRSKNDPKLKKRLSKDKLLIETTKGPSEDLVGPNKDMPVKKMTLKDLSKNKIGHKRRIKGLKK